MSAARSGRCHCTEFYNDPNCESVKRFVSQAAPEDENQARLWGTCPVCKATHGVECRIAKGLISSASTMFSKSQARHWHQERVEAAPTIVTVTNA